MKKNLSAFMSGVLATTLVFGIGTSALAASGKLTITVDPINIQVNGQTFAPKDANGKPVDVFAYNGTTYAPLRALAEAYGLEVGYDAKTNMATVVDPNAPTNTTAPSTDYSEWSAEEEAAYQEFKGMWERDEANDYITSMSTMLAVNCSDATAFKSFCTRNSQDFVQEMAVRYSKEITPSHQEQPNGLFYVRYAVNNTPLWDDMVSRTGHGTSHFYTSLLNQI